MSARFSHIVPTDRSTLTVALVGNPNAGKTTLFNALTGYHRHVANYPGVTVDVADGPLRGALRSVELLDLPGTYSLAAVSPDEMVVCRALHGRLPSRKSPDAILAIVDASNLPRNLYLVSQLLELDRPLVVALNMMDVARRRGFEIDAEKLSSALGVPVIPIVATDAATLPPLVRALEASIERGSHGARAPLPAALWEEAQRLAETGGAALAAPEALRALMDFEGASSRQYAELGGDPAILEAARARLVAVGIDGAPAEIRARYAWIHEIVGRVLTRGVRQDNSVAARLDRWLTHRLLGAAVLFLVLGLVFQAVFSWARPLMWLIDEKLIGSFKGWVAGAMPEGMLNSLIVDGVIGGVGGVLVFLPQIAILFALIAILEDCGYMARAAFMMDRLMGLLGLSGRAFIPLLSSFACAVPAIMGTRVISDRRERLVTILIAPFMSCSARLPVYVLLISSFVPAREYWGGVLNLQGLVMFAMYLVGVVVAIPIAWLLKRTALRGPRSTFVLELPSYKVPRLRAIWQRVAFASRGFLVRAGTVILGVSVVVWALAYFPHAPAVGAAAQAAASAAGVPDDEITRAVDGAYLRDSYLGRAGRWIEPVIKPIGWDWRIGMAVVASFPAREVVIATLGTIFNLGGDVDENNQGLRAALAGATWPETGKPLFTLPVALSLMVFFALCAQCASTLAVIGRETGSWIWPVLSFVGMTVIAYAAALGTESLARYAGF